MACSVAGGLPTYRPSLLRVLLGLMRSLKSLSPFKPAGDLLEADSDFGLC